MSLQSFMGWLMVIGGFSGLYYIQYDIALQASPFAFGAVMMELSMFIIWGFREVMGAEMKKRINKRKKRI